MKIWRLLAKPGCRSFSHKRLLSIWGQRSSRSSSSSLPSPSSLLPTSTALSFFSFSPSSGWVPQVTSSSQPRRGFKIYTRTGDTGETSLFNGKRAQKTAQTFEALGNTDELNSFIGVALQHCEKAAALKALGDKLREIQSRLLDVGSHIATPKSSSPPDRVRAVEFDDYHVDQLETWMDEMETELPELKNFILPGGGDAGAALHVVRSVARRTERSVIPLVFEGDVDKPVLKYLNRLSDFFFVAARLAAAKTNEMEVVYVSSGTSNQGKKIRSAVPRNADGSE